MAYKVFLVEDEIVTREGIRDNVDWEIAGFEFIGEAPDGEMALPLIEKTNPDVLITDIKMPFMDGLQLSKVIHEHMPWIKVIILSGHDEFEYAQTAVKIGVAEYLLKPVNSDDLVKVLSRIKTTLDHEHREKQDIRKLQEREEVNLVLIRDNYLLKLLLGGITTTEAIEQGQQLGLNVIASTYQVLAVKAQFRDLDAAYDYHKNREIEEIITRIAENNPSILRIKKDLGEYALLCMGENEDQTQHETAFLSDIIKKEVDTYDECDVLIGVGAPKKRLGDIHISFMEAQNAIVKKLTESNNIQGGPINQKDLLKLDGTALEDFLRCGEISDYEVFYAENLEQVCIMAASSFAVKHFLIIDSILSMTQFLESMGEKINEVAPEIQDLEELLEKNISKNELDLVFKNVIQTIVQFRDSQTTPQRINLVWEAKAYTESNFQNPDLKMSEVAHKFNLSAGYFSTLFSQEVGKTFKEYLTDLRIQKSKELLRSTNLKNTEIALRSGFNDPHYFSTVFKKMVGSTPQQYRKKPQSKRDEL
ncbi:MAG: response regulator [Anaerolineales bacterium]|nr:response regulator [Anaerolineales bacterium]